ncbi:substrate-binding periplasmic protein [Thalassotalea profundi]|uniref:Amino acid ABC transporter substrate-binding protein n=1 Tax=Thalassotalea profundi TaxID=2036687 RepID=A0ABQ3IEP2_9GAMM|nr:transporter substrate-binding domain-containing protein [Thalassotalea profundi]GHE78148.1 amino acid ABC transporter substrate-binding protein [Thalassotalea profundi]
MISFSKIFFLLYLIPLTVFAQTGLNSDDPPLLNKRIVLTAAFEEIGYFPYSYEENGEIKGFTIDILNYFEAHSNYDFEFIIIPWARALHLVAQGEVDLILTFFKNAKREKTYHFIEPSYGFEVNQLFTLVDKKLEFNGQLQQLTPYSIGTKRAYSYGERFDQTGYLTKLPALSEKVLLKLLLNKRVDVVISNPFIFKKLAKELQVTDKIKAIEPVVDITPVYLGLTKARADAKEIKQTLGKLTKKLKASAYYQELLEKYQLNFK